MKPVRLVSVVLVAFLVGLLACSSDDSSAADSCQAASDVSKKCDAQQSSSDGGSSVKVTTTFDVAKCQQSDQGKKIADCMVANQNNCDCMLKCALSGGSC